MSGAEQPLLGSFDQTSGTFKIIARDSLTVCKPWTVRKSKKHENRWYFMNTVTRETKWSLEPSVLGITLQEMNSQSTEHSEVTTTASRNRHQEHAHQYENSVDDVEQFPSRLNDRYDLVGALGLGGSAVVVEVQDKLTEGRFAAKVVFNLNSVEARERLGHELAVVEKLPPSSFVQKLQNAFVMADSIVMVMDLYTGGDLFFHLMNRPSFFSEAETRILVAEVTLALEHVHRHGYIHRDIKLENVMLDTAGHVKLIDFGLARKLEREVQPESPRGSLSYTTPEMLVSQTGGRHTDWWAVGIMMHEMMTGSGPWELGSKNTVMSDILYKTVVPPANMSPEAGQFVDALLEKDFKVRLGTDSDAEVKAAPFFDSINWVMTARLESPPAFVPQGVCVSASEKAEALKKYRELFPPDAAPVKPMKAALPKRKKSFNCGHSFAGLLPPIRRRPSFVKSFLG